MFCLLIQYAFHELSNTSVLKNLLHHGQYEEYRNKINFCSDALNRKSKGYKLKEIKKFKENTEMEYPLQNHVSLPFTKVS